MEESAVKRVGLIALVVFLIVIAVATLYGLVIEFGTDSAIESFNKKPGSSFWRQPA